MNAIVVHYKELALKGRNRPWFVRMLVRNLKASLAGLGVRAIRVLMGRIEIELGIVSDRKEVSDRLRRVFGIANFSYAGRAPHEIDKLSSIISSDLGERHAASLRVAATRADKRLPFTSPQVERELGALIQK